MGTTEGTLLTCENGGIVTLKRRIYHMSCCRLKNLCLAGVLIIAVVERESVRSVRTRVRKQIAFLIQYRIQVFRYCDILLSLINMNSIPEWQLAIQLTMQWRTHTNNHLTLGRNKIRNNECDRQEIRRTLKLVFLSCRTLDDCCLDALDGKLDAGVDLDKRF